MWSAVDATEGVLSDRWLSKKRKKTTCNVILPVTCSGSNVTPRAIGFFKVKYRTNVIKEKYYPRRCTRRIKGHGLSDSWTGRDRFSYCRLYRYNRISRTDGFPFKIDHFSILRFYWTYLFLVRRLSSPLFTRITVEGLTSLWIWVKLNDSENQPSRDRH